MGSKLFVGGLPWAVDAAALRAAFSPFGRVEDAVVITDRETGRSRGFGFVTFGTADEARAAAAAMNESRLAGRTINVREARERAGGASRHPGSSRGPGPNRAGDRGPRDRGPFRGTRDPGSEHSRGRPDPSSAHRDSRPPRPEGPPGQRHSPRSATPRGPLPDRRPSRSGPPAVERDEWGFVIQPAPPRRHAQPPPLAGGPPPDDPEAAGWIEDRQRRRDRSAPKKKIHRRRRNAFDDDDW